MAGDICKDQDRLPVHFIRCPRSELSDRTILVWQQRALAIVETECTTMGGLSNSDVKITRDLFKSQPMEH